MYCRDRMTFDNQTCVTSKGESGPWWNCIWGRSWRRLYAFKVLLVLHLQLL